MTAELRLCSESSSAQMLKDKIEVFREFLNSVLRKDVGAVVHDFFVCPISSALLGIEPMRQRVPYIVNTIWSYYFPETRWVDRTFPQLWRMKQFKTFNHYLMEETFLLKKLSLVDAIRKVPKQEYRAITL